MKEKYKTYGHAKTNIKYHVIFSTKYNCGHGVTSAPPSVRFRRKRSRSTLRIKDKSAQFICHAKDVASFLCYFRKIVLRIANKHRLFVKFVRGVDGSKHIVLVGEHYEPHHRVGVLCNDCEDVETPSKNLVSYWFLKYHDVFSGYDRILKEKNKYGILSDSVSELEMKLTLGGY